MIGGWIKRLQKEKEASQKEKKFTRHPCKFGKTHDRLCKLFTILIKIQQNHLETSHIRLLIKLELQKKKSHIVLYWVVFKMIE